MPKLPAKFDEAGGPPIPPSAPIMPPAPLPPVTAEDDAAARFATSLAADSAICARSRSARLAALRSARRLERCSAFSLSVTVCVGSWSGVGYCFRSFSKASEGIQASVVALMKLRR